MERLENSLRDALFSEADEASFLAIYKRSFAEDTSAVPARPQEHQVPRCR